MNDTKIMQNSKRNTVLEKITTIHGTNQLTLKHGREFTLWVFLMVFNALLTVTFIFVIKDRYYSDAIYTRIDANCQVRQVPFPAVGICNFNLVSLKNMKNIERILKHNKIEEHRIESYFEALTFLKDYRIGSNAIELFKDISQILKHHYFTTDSIMEEIHQKCENLLIYCSFNRKVKKCENIFTLVKTLEGHCCLFNYAGLNDASENSMLQHDDDLEYYEDYSDESKVTTNIIATSESGRTSGLLVILDVEPNDYPPWSSLLFYGAKVIITDPNDYPEMNVAYKYVTPGQAVDIKIEASVIQSDANLRALDPGTRRCWFHDEVNLIHTDRYSYETCNTECKMNNFLHHCGCVPYKYPIRESTRVCGFEDLHCLHNVTVYKYQLPCVPNCFEECSDKSYDVTSNLIPFVREYYPFDKTKQINYTNLSALQVYFGKSTCNCYKMKLLSDSNDIISNYGGIFSLSFGGSILTIVEFIFIIISYVFTKFINILHN